MRAKRFAANLALHPISRPSLQPWHHAAHRSSTSLNHCPRCTWPTKTKAPMRTFALFVVTALAEIIGCYLPWLWLKQGASVWLLLPAAASLALFSWLLTLHPDASGRIYAAYGGVYVSVALLWLWAVDGVRPTLWDAAGVALCLAGMLVIMLAPRS